LSLARSAGSRSGWANPRARQPSAKTGDGIGAVRAGFIDHDALGKPRCRAVGAPPSPSAHARRDPRRRRGRISRSKAVTARHSRRAARAIRGQSVSTEGLMTLGRLFRFATFTCLFTSTAALAYAEAQQLVHSAAFYVAILATLVVCYFGEDRW